MLHAGGADGERVRAPASALRVHHHLHLVRVGEAVPPRQLPPDRGGVPIQAAHAQVAGGDLAWLPNDIAAGDFDRDDDDDLFISHWIAQGYALYESLLSQQKGMANEAELHFTDVAANMGIGQPSLQRIGWGASFVDFDSDGWSDLLIANGSTFDDSQDGQVWVRVQRADNQWNPLQTVNTGFIGKAGYAGLAMLGCVVQCFRIGPWLGVSVLGVMVLASPFLFMWMMELWPRTPVGRRLVLNATVPQAERPAVIQRGQEGKTVTELRPIGECDFGAIRAEVISEYGIIAAGSVVKVIAHEADGHPVVQKV